MQRYVGQLKRKALVYRQSIKGSFRRRKQNTTEKPVAAQQFSHQTQRRKRLQKQKNLNFNEELASSYPGSQEQKDEISDANEVLAKTRGVSRSTSNEICYQGIFSNY